MAVLLRHEGVIEFDDADAVLAGFSVDQLEMSQHLGGVLVVVHVWNIRFDIEWQFFYSPSDHK